MDCKVSTYLILQLLAILAFTANPAFSQNTAPLASSLLPEPSRKQENAQCPVSIQYAVNLGQTLGQDSALVPIFFTTITIKNNQAPSLTTANNLTIESWRMGWKFPFNSTIKTKEDVFDPSVVLLTPDSNTPVLEQITNTSTSPSSSLNGIAPGESRQFGFLGTKGSVSNPYNVGAVTGMVFNNLLCTMISSPQQQQQQLATTDAVTSGASQLEIQYTPIQYRDEPTLVNTFTQFLVRVRNTGNGSTIELPSIGLQYWFQGPATSEGGNLPSDVDASSPWDYFEARCEWATIGCDKVILGISTGYTDVDGAQFALNVTLAEDAGPLLPSGDSAVPALFLGQQGIDVLDLLLTITTKTGVVLLNSTQDYSFLNTPVLAEDGLANAPQQQQQQQQRLNTTARNGGVLVPRKAQINRKIPAYINGQLAWGILPSSTSSSSSSSSSPSSTKNLTAPEGGVEGGVQLPDGVFCESIRGSAQQSCTVQAVYCCTPADPSQQPGVSTTIPTAAWPPKAGTTNSTLNGTTVNLPSNNSSTNISTNSAPGQEESTTAFFPPLPEPGLTQNQQIAATEQSSNNNGGGGSLAWIAGIAVGIAVGGVLGGAFLIAWRRKRHRRLRKEAIAALAAGGSIGGGNNGYPPALFTVVSSELPLSGKRAASGEVHRSSSSFVGGGGGSAHSSPHYPLLLSSSPAGSHSGLYKYSSGISGTSTTSTDPTAVLDGTFNSTNFSTGGGNSPFAVLPGTVLEGNNISATFMHHGGVGSIMEANGNEEHQLEEENSGAGGVKALPSNILQLLERKARTCPGSLFSHGGFGGKVSHPGAKKKQRNKKQHRRASVGGDSATPAAAGELTGLAALDRFAKSTKHSSSSSSSLENSDSEEEEGDVFSSHPDIEPWQLRRSSSWDGILQDPHSSDSFSQIINLKRRRTAPQFELQQPLPPLAPLPSSLLPAQQEPDPGIDLDVDPAEILGNLGRCLGTGGFGSVFEAEWRGRKVAVKMLPSFSGSDTYNGGGGNASGDAAYQALFREIRLASKFNNDRLVKVLGACTRDKNNCFLILELAENGSLFHRIHDRRKRRLSYLEILQIGHDIACGLAYLHPAVVHRDLKPQNVLLDSSNRAKLADFGISRIKDPTKSYFSQVTAENGTPMYMAPEAMNGTRVDEKVDIYALGVILNECWTRRQPWKDSAHFFQIILKVAINGERPWTDPDCPAPLKRLITKCWHQDPRQRPSCADVMRLTDLLMQDEFRKYEDLVRKW